MNKNTDFFVIVSYYDADISWTKKIKYPYEIFYKEHPEKEPFNAPNKAKSESNVFKFLFEFYDKLPKNIIFVHQYEYKWYHKGSLVDILNSSDLIDAYKNSKTSGFLSINNYPLGDIYPQVPKMINSGWWNETMKPYFGNIHNYHNFTKNKGAAAQFIVSRERVHSLPKEFYKNMFDWLVKNSIGDTNRGINPINTMRISRPIDNHILSNYHTARYLEWSYELIFATYKELENNYEKLIVSTEKEIFVKDDKIEDLTDDESSNVNLIDNENIKININEKKIIIEEKEYEILSLYGYDKYYINVTKLFIKNFIKDNKVIIPKYINFNKIFDDYLFGSYKNIKLSIKNKLDINIMEKRDKDFIYNL